MGAEMVVGVGDAEADGSEGEQGEERRPERTATKETDHGRLPSEKYAGAER
jgi:hypothetical protein